MPASVGLRSVSSPRSPASFARRRANTGGGSRERTGQTRKAGGEGVHVEQRQQRGQPPPPPALARSLTPRPTPLPPPAAEKGSTLRHAQCPERAARSTRPLDAVGPTPLSLPAVPPGRTGLLMGTRRRRRRWWWPLPGQATSSRSRRPRPSARRSTPVSAAGTATAGSLPPSSTEGPEVCRKLSGRFG